jgi:hypothetical protein
MMAAIAEITKQSQSPLDRVAPRAFKSDTARVNASEILNKSNASNSVRKPLYRKPPDEPIPEIEHLLSSDRVAHYPFLDHFSLNYD